jgi:hypothetical protein
MDFIAALKYVDDHRKEIVTLAGDMREASALLTAEEVMRRTVSAATADKFLGALAIYQKAKPVYTLAQLVRDLKSLGVRADFTAGAVVIGAEIFGYENTVTYNGDRLVFNLEADTRSNYLDEEIVMDIVDIRRLHAMTGAMVRYLDEVDAKDEG